MVAARERHAILDARSCEFEDILQLLTTAPDTKPTCLYVRYSVAMGWKADFEQAASVIVLCARQGASLRRRRWRNKESLSARLGAQAIGIGAAPGCLWAKARVAFVRPQGVRQLARVDAICYSDL
jgi:hypothetical protein